MRRLTYLMRVPKQLIAFAGERKKYWLFPLLVILALATLVVVAGQGASPFIYTLF